MRTSSTRPASSTTTTPLRPGRLSGARTPAWRRGSVEHGEIRVVGDGTDLTLGVEGRTWVPCDGRENFPDGEVFTGPVETKVDGTIRFTYPSGYAGRRVGGVELEFRGGEVVRAEAEEGETFLREMLALDDGARRAGEFSFGLNEAVTEFTGHTLFDEKIGGTVHLALGASYPESGGRCSLRSTGTSSAICGAEARSTPTASLSTATAAFSTAFSEAGLAL